MFDGAYPPGVTGNEPELNDYGQDECCKNCDHYFHGSCTIAERDYSAEEIEAMSDEEYSALTEKDPDDFCDSWEHEEYEPDPSDLAREAREYRWMAEANGWED